MNTDLRQIVADMVEDEIRETVQIQLGDLEETGQEAVVEVRILRVASKKLGVIFEHKTLAEIHLEELQA